MAPQQNKSTDSVDTSSQLNDGKKFMDQKRTTYLTMDIYVELISYTVYIRYLFSFFWQYPLPSSLVCDNAKAPRGMLEVFGSVGSSCCKCSKQPQRRSDAWKSRKNATKGYCRFFFGQVGRFLHKVRSYKLMIIWFFNQSYLPVLALQPASRMAAAQTLAAPNEWSKD